MHIQDFFQNFFKLFLVGLHGDCTISLIAQDMSPIFSHSVTSVFLNGFMHMMTLCHGIVVVDMEGTAWRTIPVPSVGPFGCIDQAQGRLCFLNVHDADAFKLSIWILEDHGTNEWTLKHSVRTPLLFPQKNPRFVLGYKVITVHPECNNLIYFVYGRDDTLMAYEMDRKEIHVIRNLGHDYWEPCLMFPCSRRH